MTPILPKKHSDILKLVKNEKIHSDIPTIEREKIDILYNLKNDGYITGIIEKYYNNVVTDNLRITIKGENALTNKKPTPHWYFNPFLIAGLLLVASLIVAWITGLFGWISK